VSESRPLDGPSLASGFRVAQLRYRCTNWGISIGGICALVATLVVFDERVRTLVANTLTTESFGRLAGTIARGQQLVHGAYATVSQSPEHASLTLFALVAGVLLLLMVRS
jgi:hypothetical protein